MGKAGTIRVAIVVPLLAAAWACGGSATSEGSDGGGGGYGSSGGSSSGGGGPCGAQSCASGCCDDNGVCQGGTSDTQCGTGNIACQDCTELGKTCQAGECGAGGPGGTSSGGTSFPGLPGYDGGTFPGLGNVDAGLSCTDGSGCPGQVCCFSLTGFGSSCQASCSMGSYQLCADSTDCPTGQTCSSSPFGATSPGYCAAVMPRPGRADAGQAADASGAVDAATAVEASASAGDAAGD